VVAAPPTVEATQPSREVLTAVAAAASVRVFLYWRRQAKVVPLVMVLPVADQKKSVLLLKAEVVLFLVAAVEPEVVSMELPRKRG